MRINPDDQQALAQALGDQFGKALQVTILAATTKAAAEMLVKLTGTNGPWLLRADGTIEDPQTPENPPC